MSSHQNKRYVLNSSFLYGLLEILIHIRETHFFFSFYSSLFALSSDPSNLAFLDTSRILFRQSNTPSLLPSDFVNIPHAPRHKNAIVPSHCTYNTS